MKLPLAWLKQYIDPKVSAEALAERLTLTGTKVECVEHHHGEPVIDIEVTTNRPDCLSILGLAREVAAITGKSALIPKDYSIKEKKRSGKASWAIRIEDKKACPYYTARLIEGVSVASAPSDAAGLLELMGTRPISNIVDVTNYVLFESGQPLHAFDADKLQGGQVVVRRARAGESIVGIDGAEYKLDPETLVIADAVRPVAIAGVMGGKATEVTATTKRVLLESAWFDPALVRRASKKFKISTESSYRFERRVNIDNVAPASYRASNLIREWAKGQDVSGLMESAKVQKASGKVSLRLQHLESVLGTTIPQKRVADIFKKLGLAAQSSAGRITVQKTAGRNDLQIEEDLIEEVLRIEGFEKIPVTLPVTRHSAGRPNADLGPGRVRALKHHLASSGFREILTYSLLSSRAVRDTGLDEHQAARIANFVSAEQEFLRPSLLPGVLGAVAFNANRKASSLRLFEIGKRYSKNALYGADCFEETMLAVAAYGMQEENWKRKSEFTVYDIKGAVIHALALLGASVEFRTGGSKSLFDSSAEILEAGRVIGQLGEVAASVRKNWDIPQPVYFAEVSLTEILSRPRVQAPLSAIPKYPLVRRDLAFVLSRSVPVDKLVQVMQAAADGHLQQVRLFDEFTGKNIPADRRSLAFALSYRKDSGTFTDAEIQVLQAQVVEALTSQFGVEFR